MQGIREGVIPLDYFVLCDLDSLDQRLAKSPGNLTALTGDFSLLPSVDVAGKTRHSQTPFLIAWIYFQSLRANSET